MERTRARGEQKCLGDDCRCSPWSEPFSLTYTPGLNQRGAGGGRGNIGCGWVHSTSPGDHQRRATCLPSCLSECRSVPSIIDKGLFFNETTQTRAHVYRHRQHTHTEIHMNQNLLWEVEG